MGDTNFTGSNWALHKESGSARRESSAGAVRRAAAYVVIGDDAPFSVVLDGARVLRRDRGRLRDRTRARRDHVQVRVLARCS